VLTGDLSSVLAIFDRAAANLERLQAVWDEAGPLLPSDAQLGGNAKYENLARRWVDLLKGLPRIDGWTITEPLPDFKGIGQTFLDYREIGELPTSVWREVERPGTELDEYRHRLKQARGRAVRDRLQQLVDVVETRLPQVIDGLLRDSQDKLEDPRTQEISDAVDEIASLMGDATPRKGRWSDLWRHIRFGEGHDWHDISELDWPSVKQDIELAGLTDSDPLPMDEDIDLGHLAGSRPTGTASTRLDWTQLTSGEFEQLLHDLFVRLPDYEDVQLLFRENAPDKGRDVSAIRVTKSPGVYLEYSRRSV
jgi:hypothetical protein